MSGSRLIGRKRAVELEEQPVELDRLGELARLVRPADPRPQHGVLARRDRRGRVDLDLAELLGDLDDVTGALGIEQLRTHDDAAGLVAREVVRHISSVVRDDTGGTSRACGCLAERSSPLS